jgi:catechol 2,3-dioxygenase-like lactoylglutathione lyase family enzyme
MARLKGLDHVGLTVTDMARTLDFYQRLGLTLLRTSGPRPDGASSAVMQVENQELNIFSRSERVSTGTAPLVGMDHLCFLVDAASIDDVIADLRHAGIDIVKGPDRRRDGTALFVHDPDGGRVELQLKTPTAS